MKSLIFLATFLSSFILLGQKKIEAETIPTNKPIELVGTKIFVDGTEYSHFDLKQHLSTTNAEAYDNFKAYKTKSSVGGFLIGMGGALIVGDLVRGLTSDVDYPGGMTYVGIGALAVSIPVLVGRKNKLQKSIDAYNDGLSTEKTTGSALEIDIVSNQNGIGLNIRF